MKPIAISTPEPFAPLPGVPTYVQLGLPQLTVSSWTGISGLGMPAPVVAEMHAAMQTVLADADTSRRLIAAGLYPLTRTYSSADYQQVRGFRAGLGTGGARGADHPRLIAPPG